MSVAMPGNRLQQTTAWRELSPMTFNKRWNEPDSVYSQAAQMGMTYKDRLGEVADEKKKKKLQDAMSGNALQGIMAAMPKYLDYMNKMGLTNLSTSVKMPEFD
jgi:hypothetical protein